MEVIHQEELDKVELKSSGRDPMTRKLPLVECFGPTVQGEGALAGTISHFIRLGGCSRRCVWCDSLHAVLPAQIKANAQYITQDEIAARLFQLPPAPWVTLSGGDPVMWDIDLLISRLMDKFHIAVETQGDLSRDWLNRVDHITFSPKPPSAGGDAPNYKVLDKWLELAVRRELPTTCLKIVVFDETDLNFAEHMHEKYPHVPMYLSSGTPQQTEDEMSKPVSEEVLKLAVCEGYRRLCEAVLERQTMKNVKVFPQLHVLAWGGKKGV